MKQTLLALAILASLFLFHSCATPGAHPLDTIEYEYVDIPCDKDTLITMDKGVKLFIRKGSVKSDSEDGRAQIKFASVLDVLDMIKYQLYTQTNDGEMLESGGMFFLDVLGGSVNPDLPVQVKIPASSVNPDMKVFVLEDGDPSQGWIPTEQAVLAAEAKEIETGKRLFDTNCAACHASDLQSKLTGPMLGNVHLFRNMDWLIRFTKNSQQMIAAGDSLALCLWAEWKPTLMNDFNHLSDKEIKDIYTYIANESNRLGIQPNANSFRLDCNLDFLDTATQQEPVLFNYIASTTGTQWINIDRFYAVNNRINRIEVEGPEDLVVMLAFKDHNVCMGLTRYEDQYVLWGTEDQDRIPFPEDETILITAFSADQYAMAWHTTTKENNRIKLEMKPLSNNEYNELLKNFWTIKKEN
jgi:mono/diheme cytochrome c family protein